MNVNQKGVSGLIKVIDDLQEKGYYVFPAFDDHSPVDLIALDNMGRTFRIQIKYREKCSNKKSERYEIRTSSVVNGKRIENDRSMIDGWAVYMANSKKIAYISKNLLDDKKGLVIDPNVEYGDMAEWSKAASC
jgi:hypothetical protein